MTMGWCPCDSCTVSIVEVCVVRPLSNVLVYCALSWGVLDKLIYNMGYEHPQLLSWQKHTGTSQIGYGSPRTFGQQLGHMSLMFIRPGL